MNTCWLTDRECGIFLSSLWRVLKSPYSVSSLLVAWRKIMTWANMETAQSTDEMLYKSLFFFSNSGPKLTLRIFFLREKEEQPRLLPTVEFRNASSGSAQPSRSRASVSTLLTREHPWQSGVGVNSADWIMLQMSKPLLHCQVRMMEA